MVPFWVPIIIRGLIIILTIPHMVHVSGLYFVLLNVCYHSYWYNDDYYLRGARSNLLA